MADEIDQTSSTEAPSGPQEVVVVDAPKPSLEETMAKVYDDIQAREPTREDNGRFKAKVVAAAGAPEVAEVPGQSQAAPPDPAQQVIEAPQSWPAEVKGKWQALPPDVQKYILDREGEVHKKFTSDGERLNVLTAIEQATAPYQARLREVGVPAHEYFRNLMSFDVGLKQNPVEAVRALEEYTGLNFAQLSKFSGQPMAQGQQPDPTSALSRQFHELRAQVDTLGKQNEQAQLNAAKQTIEEFAKDKPHLNALEPLMVKLIDGGLAKGLPDAYEQAAKLHPEVSKLIAAEAAEAARKKAEEEAKEKALKDRKAATFAQRPGSAPTAPVKGKDIWDTLSKTADEVYAR